ncbi:MAG: hypothetical protein ABI542_09620 [Gemmatimonadota bacterium]
MTARVVGWFLLVSGLLAVLAAYLLVGAAVAGLLPSLLMIFGVGTTLAGPLLLASPGRRATGLLALAAGTVLLVVIAGFVLALTSADDQPAGVSVIGLPFRAAIILLGVGLLPALVLPWTYARAASREKLDPESIRAFVAECRTARTAEPGE